MKTFARIFVIVAWGVVIGFVAFCDGVREAVKKLRLRRYYEGPLES